MIMPVKDGLLASEEILAHYAAVYPKHPAPIILAMTASAMEADRKACTKAGMVSGRDRKARFPISVLSTG